jgi:hypothetical protein
MKISLYLRSIIASTIFVTKVPGGGLEPPRPCEHMPLKHACLPISAPGLGIEVQK